jgi:16S rRNA (adenine1518-N6/adenine1519-N6)-dimethyltransferase
MAHRARKRFGQNFLQDHAVIDNIIAAIAPHRDDIMVEIGPGLGALTRELLQCLDTLHVIELDRDLIPELQRLGEQGGELQIHNADALKFDFTRLTQTACTLRIVGNLPYNISTPLLFHLLDCLHSIRDMHFMLQNEVVDRLAAAPGGKAYGRLSVMVQYHCRVEKLFTVPPGAFRPQPRVDSAVVRLTPITRHVPQCTDLRLFNRVVTQAFSQRRKTLRNALRPLADAALFETLGIDARRRPETLTLEEFVNITNAIAAHVKQHDRFE